MSYFNEMLAYIKEEYFHKTPYKVLNTRDNNPMTPDKTELVVSSKDVSSLFFYLTKTSAKLEDVENNSRHQEIADILMANLHNIKPNASEATLFDFYKNEQLTIKLKKDLSPQKNAEYLYRKAKNQKINY